jgi:hypothetical protein
MNSFAVMIVTMRGGNKPGDLQLRLADSGHTLNP